MVNEEDYSTIRIKSSLRNVLDSYKVEAESYSVVITNLINNIHKATYFIVKVIEDKTLDNTEQLRLLKEYLSEMLATDKDSVIATISNLKEMLELEEADVPEVLIEFEKYVLNIGS